MLEPSPPAEKLCESRSSEAVGRNCRQECEHSLVFAQIDVRHLLKEADVPAGGGAILSSARILPADPQLRAHPPRARARVVTSALGSSGDASGGRYPL